MKKRLIAGVFLIGILVYALLRFAHWVGPTAQTIVAIKEADFIVINGAQSESGPIKATIPHKWPTAIPDNVRAIYRVEIPQIPNGIEWALSISDYMPGTEAFIGELQLPQRQLTGHIGEVFLVSLDFNSSGKVIELRVPWHFGLRGGIGKILMGPMALLDRQARVQSNIREVSHLWGIGMSLAVCVFALAVNWFRGDPLLLALGAVSMGIFIRQAMPYVSGYWIDDGVELALFASANALAVIGMYFLIQYGTSSRNNGISYLALILFPVLLWLHFNHIGDLEHRRILNTLFIFFLWASAWIRFGRKIIQDRNWLLLWLLGIFSLRTISGVVAMVTNHGLLGFDDTEQQTRPIPFGVLIAMLFAARHIYLSMRNYQQININLSNEVAAYKAELTAISEREKALAIEQAASAERLHWMQEIHDGLGSHLIAARFLADKATHINHVREVKLSIDEGIEELRELVEALSSEPSTIPSLIGAMRYRIMSRFESGGIVLKWNVDPMIEASELTPIEALNVQRIIQEALTNILKHAESTTVSIHIFTQGPTIVVRIDDDGKGFDSDIQTPGCGLQNIINRARECKGLASWTPLEPGTRFELTLPN